MATQEYTNFIASILLGSSMIMKNVSSTLHCPIMKGPYSIAVQSGCPDALTAKREGYREHGPGNPLSFVIGLR